VCFTAACLTVGEHGAIVTADDAFDERKPALVVDFLLDGVVSVDAVKRENSALSILGVFWFPQTDLAVVAIDANNLLTP
jgi:hypothetical protein